MTTFHSEKRVKRSEVELMFASCSDPDAVGAEARIGDQELFSIYFEVDGRRSVRFGSIDDVEFDAAEFKALIDSAYNRLVEWDASLREEGGTWHSANI